MYFLSIPLEHKNNLASIRHFNELKLANSDQTIWIKGLLEEHIESISIKRMPHKIIYEERGQLLFQRDKLVPTTKLPTGLLWSPIHIALPLVRFQYNHHFFGVKGHVDLKLKPCSTPQKAVAILVEYADLKLYLESAPSIRLNHLNWCRIDQQILVFGEPILPMRGQSFWLNNNILLPSGFNFEFSSLSKVFSDALVGRHEIMVYMNQNDYIIVQHKCIQPLSIGSFKRTFGLTP